MEAVVMTVLLASNGRRRQVEVVYMWTCYLLTQDELSCLGRPDLCQQQTVPECTVPECTASISTVL